jgi:NAD(P) transhydrogenase subunit alpha
MLTLFAPKESEPGEARAAVTPDSVRRLIKAGAAVKVERGVGRESMISDAAYEEAGADVVDDAAAAFATADVVLKLNPPSLDEVERMRPGSTLVSFVYPAMNKALSERLVDKRISTLAMESIPRISRAQKMDALSSQANLAGYKAVIQAADALPRLFPMLMTAAGTIQPAHVVILGAGVAGLQAVATAKRLGAIVEVSDVRPAVKEQVESLGGKFIDVPTDESMEDQGGYAKEQSDEFLRRQRDIVRKRIIEADVVITTAAIPGKRAPMLIPAETVESMKTGSVIVDLAVETGGNCELSESGKVIKVHGVTIIGLEKVPSLVAVNATDVYARNVVNLLSDMIKDGKLVFDLEDEVVEGALVIHDGVPRGPAAGGSA